MLAIMSRSASGRPDISRPMSKPSRSPNSRCPSAICPSATLSARLTPILRASSRRSSLTSVITTLRAPACRATAAAIRPIGPAPVISTSSPTSGKDSAVCTALPNGSKIAATSSSTGTRCTHTLAAGRATYSAKAPSLPTPSPTVARHRCRRPARQLRHLPQTRCPSPLTRSPTWISATSRPVPTTSPTNSCPRTSGVRIACCAQPSQFRMCRSVPQIPVRSTLISTSPGPTAGSGTSASQSPGSALSLTSAFTLRLLWVRGVETPSNLPYVAVLVHRGFLKRHHSLASRLAVGGAVAGQLGVR